MALDYDSFPASIYAQSVLSPDLDVYRQHFSAPLHAINLSHGVMLAEIGLIQSADASAILDALNGIDRERPWANQLFDGSFEDLFFLIEQELGRRVGDETAGRLHTGRSRNDMEHTMFRIQLRARLLTLLKRYEYMADHRSPVFPRGASPQARGVTRGHGPLYEEGMDLDVVDVGGGECPRPGAQHHGQSRVH